MRWGLAVVLALALTVPGSLFVALADGGPPPETEGGATLWRPLVEEWRILASSPPDAPMGGVLCSDAAPCDAGKLADAAAAGMTCAFEATVWLSGGGRGTPAVLRDVEVLLAVIIEAGAGGREREGVVNVSHQYAEFPVAWPNGWWWRAESERVHVTTPTPCDARVVKLMFNFASRTLTGRDVALAQTAETRLVPWEGAPE